MMAFGSGSSHDIHSKQAQQYNFSNPSQDDYGQASTGFHDSNSGIGGSILKTASKMADYSLAEPSVDSAGFSKESMPVSNSIRNREAGTQGQNMNNQWMKPSEEVKVATQN